MSTTPDPYRGFRFPTAIISEAVWLYHCFSLFAANGRIVGVDVVRTEVDQEAGDYSEPVYLQRLGMVPELAN